MMKAMMLHDVPASQESENPMQRAGVPQVVHGFAYGVGLSALAWAVIAMIVVGIT